MKNLKQLTMSNVRQSNIMSEIETDLNAFIGKFGNNTNTVEDIKSLIYNAVEDTMWDIANKDKYVIKRKIYTLARTLIVEHRQKST